MPTIDRELCVFLCHASQDKPIVRDLHKRLLAEGWIGFNPKVRYTKWVDESSYVGTSCIGESQNAIRK